MIALESLPPSPALAHEIASAVTRTRTRIRTGT